MDLGKEHDVSLSVDQEDKIVVRGLKDTVTEVVAPIQSFLHWKEKQHDLTRIKALTEKVVKDMLLP